MENTFLMNPFIGIDDDSLINLVRPLIAISFLKDVRSASVNINEYIQKEEQIIKLEEANGEEESEPSSCVKVEELDVDLNYSMNLEQPFTIEGNIISTGRNIPNPKLSNEHIYFNRKDSTADDVVPEDERVDFHMVEFTAKSDCFAKLNKLAKEISAGRLPKLDRKQTILNMPAVKNSPILHGIIITPKSSVQTDSKKQVNPHEALLQIEDLAKRHVENQSNFNSMANLEESRGDGRSRSVNRHSASSLKMSGNPNTSVIARRLRLQSYNEIDEILQRMNSTARKLV
jgi:hypothetical protein